MNAEVDSQIQSLPEKPDINWYNHNNNLFFLQMPLTYTAELQFKKCRWE